MKCLKWFAIWGCFLLVFFTQGCLFARTKLGAEGLHNRLQRIRPGMTLERVAQVAGELPHAMIPSKEGSIAIYNMGDAKTKGLTLVLFNMSRTTSVFTSAYIFLDKDSCVKRVWMEKKQPTPPWQWYPF